MGMWTVEMIPASENKTTLMALIKNQLPSATIYLPVGSAYLVSVPYPLSFPDACTTYPTGLEIRHWNSGYPRADRKSKA